VALFARAGFEVLPVGADYRAFGACRGVDCWVPSAGALAVRSARRFRLGIGGEI